MRSVWSKAGLVELETEFGLHLHLFKLVETVCVCVCLCSCRECILPGRSAPHAVAEQTGLRHQLCRRRQRLQEG